MYDNNVTLSHALFQLQTIFFFLFGIKWPQMHQSSSGIRKHFSLLERREIWIQFKGLQDFCHQMGDRDLAGSQSSFQI